MKTPLLALAASLLILVPPAPAAAPTISRDIEFARVGEQSLKLDLYLPPHRTATRSRR
jgi:hypothetical protein